MTKACCPGCQGTEFGTDIRKDEFHGMKLVLVYCISCGAVQGVLDGNVDANFRAIGRKLEQHINHVNPVARVFSRILSFFGIKH